MPLLFSFSFDVWFCFAYEGPGCSSIGYGAVVEIGPLTVNKNGEGLHFNNYSWNQGLIYSFLLWSMSVV